MLFELSNQRVCFEFLKPRLAAKAPLTIALIKEIHGILTGGTYDERRFVELGERPGEFKKHDYVTGIAEVGSPPEDVEKDLTELLEELANHENRENLKGRADEDENTLKAAAYFHARFEYIHPFADGNGRVGRVLLNYWLIVHGHPPIIIHDEDKRSYYDALFRYDEAEDLAPMLAFLRQQTERTWEKALERNVKHRSRMS
jgi:Fic family protein